MKDRVFQLRDGWYCMVDGRTFGTWVSRAIAVAGMRVEQRRLAKRQDRMLTRPQWNEIVSDFCGNPT